jgi:CDP-4-dehydro-6-deoxyglucose reductase, E3
MSKTLILSPSGKRIPCEEGQTILAALETQGLVLPNNCRAGACGECKLKVLKGRFDQGFILDMALSQTERASGMGLMCMAKPVDDELELEFDTTDHLTKLYPPIVDLEFVVTEMTMVTAKILRLRLRPVNKVVRFWPGQYVMIGCEDQQIPKRPYSIANTPNADGELVFFITKTTGGKTSAWIHEKLQPGDAIFIDGPYGTFVGRPTNDLPVLCLAQGSGLAPILSLSQAALLRGGFSYPATVLFSARSIEDLFEVGLMRYLEKKFKHFKFHFTLTVQDGEGDLQGRIPEVLPKLFSNLRYYDVYIAGSPEFVEDCKKVALTLGGVDEQIHTESFHTGL